MKTQVTNYTFDASAKTITFNDFDTIELESIAEIINVTKDRVIYNSVNKLKGGSVATNVLTLDFDVTLMDDSDDLTVFYLVSDNEPIPVGFPEAGLPPKSFELAVKMGLIPGYSFLDKFGHNPAITTETDPEDVWEGGGLYNFSSTADIVSLASDNIADTQDIKITGIDATGAEVIQTITLNGTTRVPLTTALWRVYRMENDGSTNLVGTVFCYTGTGTVPTIGDSEIRAIIDDGNNQTLMAVYTVPKGMVGFLYRGEVGLEYTGIPSATAEFATLTYRSRRQGGVFKIKKKISVLTNGSSNYNDKRSAPDSIPAYTDLLVRCDGVSNTVGVWATLDILLVEESKLSAEFLDLIGQPNGTPF